MKARTRLHLAGLAGVAAWLLLLASATSVAAAPAAGPPYPDAITGQRVYDYAGIFSPGAVAAAETTIRAIEDRTGAQVAVYTQVKPESDTLDLANGDARALMDQWGVGRKGFDDGLVIMFDMQDNLRHGQVSLYAGSGFKAAYLTNSDRQSIFDNNMKPYLSAADFDGALAAGLAKVDAAATPAHRDQLNQARIFNAAVGFGCLLLAATLIFLVLMNWYRVGRDPVYTSDNSVLMPAPPPGLTPAMATLLIDSKTTKRTTAAALIDLASRGLVHFSQEKHFLSTTTKLGGTGQIAEIATPEAALQSGISTWTGPDGFVGTDKMPQLRAPFSTFTSDLESLSVKMGWMRDKPSKVMTLWFVLAGVELAVAIGLAVWTANLDASGGFMGMVGFGAAAVVTACVAPFMPSRTAMGSMLRAMLLAYKRTLMYTLAASSSMDEVVARRALPWVSTPDAVMAWGVAFDLSGEIDAVMRRTMYATQTAGVQTGWYPMWWSTPGHSAFGGVGGGGGGAGMFSASAIPDVGSMVSAISSIGGSASSGGSGGGSFGGGGGGGGGGAGGGF